MRVLLFCGAVLFGGVACGDQPAPAIAPVDAAVDTGQDTAVALAAFATLCTAWPQTCDNGVQWACNPATGQHDLELGPCKAPMHCGVFGCEPGCDKAGDWCSPTGAIAWQCNFAGSPPKGLSVCTDDTARCEKGKCIPGPWTAEGKAATCAVWPFTCKAGRQWACNPKTGLHDIDGGPCKGECSDFGCRPACDENGWHCDETGSYRYNCLDNKRTEAQTCADKTTHCQQGNCLALCTDTSASCSDPWTVHACALGAPAKSLPCPASAPNCHQGVCFANCPSSFTSCTSGQQTTCVAGKPPVVVPCTGPLAKCEAGVCVVLQCQAGAHGCLDGKRSDCVNGKWVAESPCAPGEYCLEGACVPKPCATGSVGCRGAWQVACAETTVTTLDACASGPCVAGQCGTWCPDQPWCQGSVRFGCTKTLGDVGEVCAGAGKVCGKLGSAAQCVAAQCTGKASACHGALLLACNGEGQPVWGNNKCAKGKVCANDSCVQPDAPMCTPGEPLCAAGHVAVCGFDAKPVVVTPCLGPRDQCATWGTPNCEPTAVGCKVGYPQCQGDKAVRSCSGGKFGVAPCAANEVCQQGACIQPLCTPALPLPTTATEAPWVVEGVQWLQPGQGCDWTGDGKPDNAAWVLRPWLPEAKLNLALKDGTAATWVTGSEGKGPLTVMAVRDEGAGPMPQADTFDRTQPGCPARMVLSQLGNAWATAKGVTVWLPLRVQHAELRLPMRAAKVTVQPVPADPTARDLTLCAALPVAAFLHHLDALPGQAFDALGAQRAHAVDTLARDLPAVVDSDGDGTADATPVAVRLRLRAM